MDDTKHIPNCGGKILSRGRMKTLNVAQTDTINNTLILFNGTVIPLVDKNDCLYAKCYKKHFSVSGFNFKTQIKPLQVKPKPKPLKDTTLDATVSDTVKAHLRFGHISNKYLKFAAKNAGLQFGDCQDFSCKVCKTAKSTRPQFAPLGNQIASRCGELIFVIFGDLSGFPESVD